MTRAQREEAEDRRQDESIRRCIRAMLGAAQMERETLARCLGVSERTLRRRMERPEDFTLREMRILRRLDETIGGSKQWPIGA